MGNVYNRAISDDETKIKTIDDYKANLLKNDLGRSNLFLWKLNNLPRTLNPIGTLKPNPYWPLLGDIEVFVRSMSFSGMNVTQWDRNTEGFTRKIGIDTGYSSDMQVEFYGDPDLNIYMLFENWLQTVLPGMDVLNYYDDYISNCVVYQLDRDLMATREFTFNELYPNAVSPIMYSAQGALMTFTVNFTFRTWTSKLMSDPSPSPDAVSSLREHGHIPRNDI